MQRVGEISLMYVLSANLLYWAYMMPNTLLKTTNKYNDIQQ